MGFDPGFERPTCLATLKSSDIKKQSVCGWQYIYIYIYIYIYPHKQVATLGQFLGGVWIPSFPSHRLVTMAE